MITVPTFRGHAYRRPATGRRRLARQVRAAALLAAPVLAGIGAGVALPAPVPAEAVPRAAPARRRRSGRVGHLLAEVALTLAALVGLFGVAVTATAARADIRPLVVRSGSMAPTVPAGSMVLVQRVSAEALRPGDVVAVDRPDGARVMHRIVAIYRSGPMPALTLKGDANDDPDPKPVPVIEADRLRWHVPQLGRAAAWLATAPGGFALGCLVTGLTLATLRRRRPVSPEG
jgi:signal peptidase I